MCYKSTELLTNRNHRMSRKCDLDVTKAVQSGNNVSHSNRKTRRRFLPNIQSVTLHSDALNQDVTFNASVKTLRSVEHNNGLDNYLLKTPIAKLSLKAKVLKKKIAKEVAKKDGAEQEISA